ncbi:MAG TPA: hypothetical protein QF753_19340 [Victivallales bacterium]|nr:hypothetical protein [Victivallales bacterium]
MKLITEKYYLKLLVTTTIIAVAVIAVYSIKAIKNDLAAIHGSSTPKSTIETQNKNTSLSAF